MIKNITELESDLMKKYNIELKLDFWASSVHKENINNIYCNGYFIGQDKLPILISTPNVDKKKEQKILTKVEKLLDQENVKKDKVDKILNKYPNIKEVVEYRRALKQYEEYKKEINELRANKNIDKYSTKTITLHSLNEKEYPSIDVQCKVINDIAEIVKNHIEKHGKENVVKTAKKTATVTARNGKVGEIIDTRPRVERDGKVYVIGETMSTVKVEESMVIKNPDGEEYIVKPEVFKEKYIKTDKENEYKPVSKPMNYIVINKDIVFNAPWGGDMFAVKGAALNITLMDDIYAIQNEALSKTYEEVKIKDINNKEQENDLTK